MMKMTKPDPCGVCNLKGTAASPGGGTTLLPGPATAPGLAAALGPVGLGPAGLTAGGRTGSGQLAGSHASTRKVAPASSIAYTTRPYQSEPHLPRRHSVADPPTGHRCPDH